MIGANRCIRYVWDFFREHPNRLPCERSGQVHLLHDAEIIGLKLLHWRGILEVLDSVTQIGKDNFFWLLTLHLFHKSSLHKCDALNQRLRVAAVIYLAHLKV